MIKQNKICGEQMFVIWPKSFCSVLISSKRWNAKFWKHWEHLKKLLNEFLININNLLRKLKPKVSSTWKVKLHMLLLKLMNVFVPVQHITLTKEKKHVETHWNEQCKTRGNVRRNGEKHAGNCRLRGFLRH